MGFWDWISKKKVNEEEAAEVTESELELTDENAEEETEVESDAELEEESVEEAATVTEPAEESDAVVESAVEPAALVDSCDESVEEDSVAESEEPVTGEETVTSGEDMSEDIAESEEEAILEETSSMGLFARLKAGLSKTRDNIVSGMDSLFNNDEKIDEDFYDELEETLILGDIGVHTTEDILEKLRKSVKSEHIRKRTECKDFLIKTLKEIMDQGETAYQFENVPSVVFIIGVNGVGKTTSIGKLAAHLKAMNKRVMLAACDTFRAAAGSQLEEWSHRAGVEMIGGAMGQDPSSVLFDAVNAAVARNVDVLLVDTAGRLHNKKNLMDELKKMNKIIDKVCGDNLNRENMIVLDASTGQNALNQAKEFGEVADLTGIILTKMDGTAKGGIAIAIQSELGVPVKYIGVGEKISDLQKFNSDRFIDALFDVDLEDSNDSEEE